MCVGKRATHIFLQLVISQAIMHFDLTQVFKWKIAVGNYIYHKWYLGYQENAWHQTQLNQLS